MRQTEMTAGKQRKPSQLVAMISAGILLLFIIASVLLGIFIPKSSVVNIGDSKVKSIATVEDDIYSATADGKISRISETGKVKSVLDLDAYGKEKNITVGEMVSIQTRSDSENVWATTSNFYLFRLQENEAGDLEVKDYTQLNDSIMGLVEKNGYMYLLEKVGLFGCFKKYDLSKTLDEGLMSMGHLYKPEEIGNGVTLAPAKNLGVLSFEIMEREGKEYAYIMHTAGLLRFTTDCTQNNWKVEYDKKYPAEYEKQYAAAIEEKVTEEGMTEADAKAAVDANLNSVKKATNKALVKELGLISYNASTGDIEVPYDKFEKELYNNYPADGVSYRGVGYFEEKQRYYMVTNDFTVITADANQTFRDDLIGLVEFKHENTNIVLPKRPEVEGSAMFYNRDLNVGYVLYTDDSSVSRIDFNTMKIDFTATMDFNIKSLLQGESGNRIYYMYLNPHEAEAGTFIVRTATTRGRASQTLLETLLTVAIVIAVCAAIVLLFALLCWFKQGFSEKFIDVMQGFKKNWAIYAIIAATMVLVAMFCFYPAIGSISLSFFDYTQESPAKLWNDFAHYKHIFTTQGALGEFGNMFLFLASDIFTALLPPLVFAFFLTIMRNKHYSAITRTLLFIPGIIPGIATTLIWKTGIYGEYGVINALIKMFNGESVKFLTQTSTAKWSLILMGFPFVGSYLIFYGAMMNVPDSYYEAAEMDGITVIKRFVFIDVPLIFAQIKYVLIMTFIASVQNFGRTYMTTGGSWGTMTPVHTMYDNVVRGNYGRASAYATVLFIFLFFATMLNMRMSTKDNQVA
ncbi:MAG: sugar ABC transporter permease [Clostridia bacterium]|nr:sugar ABC transporter permease [Clostridia bacterium]